MDDFREQYRRQLNRTIDQQIKFGFFRNPNPVKDDEPVRVFEKIADYRKWADENLP